MVNCTALWLWAEIVVPGGLRARGATTAGTAQAAGNRRSTRSKVRERAGRRLLRPLGLLPQRRRPNPMLSFLRGKEAAANMRGSLNDADINRIRLRFLKASEKTLPPRCDDDTGHSLLSAPFFFKSVEPKSISVVGPPTAPLLFAATKPLIRACASAALLFQVDSSQAVTFPQLSARTRRAEAYLHAH